MTALSSGIESVLTVSIVDGIGETITDGLAAVALTANVTFAADTFKAYTSNAEADADVELTANVRGLIAAIFSQAPRVQTVYVIERDVGGGDSEATALADAEAAGLRAPWDYVALCTESRVAADIVSAAGFAATRRILYFAQSADADWITSGVPSGFSTITSNTQTAVMYEDTAATGAAEGWAGRVSGILPDTQRPASRIEILSVLSEYPTLLTSTQTGHIVANKANYHQVITPKGSRRWVTPGQVLSGASLALRYTVVYLEIRIIQALGGLLSRKAAAGLSIPADAAGEGMVRAELADVFATSLTAGYITPDADAGMPEGYDITIAIGSGASPTMTVTGDVSYLGEISTIAVSLTLV